MMNHVRILNFMFRIFTFNILRFLNETVLPPDPAFGIGNLLINIFSLNSSPENGKKFKLMPLSWIVLSLTWHICKLVDPHCP